MMINSAHASPFERELFAALLAFLRERALAFAAPPNSPESDAVCVVLTELLAVVEAAWNRAHEAIVAQTPNGPHLETAPLRRAPRAGEVLPPEQRASWAREKTEHDEPAPTRFVSHPNCPSPSGRKA